MNHRPTCPRLHPPHRRPHARLRPRHPVRETPLRRRCCTHSLRRTSRTVRSRPPLSILGLPAAPPVAAAVCARVCVHAMPCVSFMHGMQWWLEPSQSSRAHEAMRPGMTPCALSVGPMPCVRSELCHEPRRHRVVMLCAQREGIGPTIYVVGGAVAIVVLLAASIAICRRRTHASTHRAWATYNTPYELVLHVPAL